MVLLGAACDEGPLVGPDAPGALTTRLLLIYREPKSAAGDGSAVPAPTKRSQ
jgi:hypothetical protein